MINLLMMIKHQVSAQAARLVENVRGSVQIMMGVASLKLDTVSVTVGKGSPKEPPKDVQAVMIQPQKFVLVVTLVVHASESVRQMRVVAGNQQVHARAIVN